jgi:hypothetical protein
MLDKCFGDYYVLKFLESGLSTVLKNLFDQSPPAASGEFSAKYKSSLTDSRVDDKYFRELNDVLS